MAGGTLTLENLIIISLYVNSLTDIKKKLKKKHKTQNIGAPHNNLSLVYLRLLFHQIKTAT